MPSIINTNIPSLNAQRHLDKSQMGLETSLQRLSSGLRINGAKDDAAGLSIAERMTSQIKGLNQASRNSNDAISLAQTAEGGLNDITTALQRLRELAVQSANATNTDNDRAALQEEATQLVSEIDRISSQTDFNGIKLLNGDFQEQKFQVGANANEQILVNVTSARITDLGAVNEASLSSRQVQLASSADTNASLHMINQGDLIINGTTIAGANASDDTASVSLPALSAIAKAAAINKVSDETGVTAKANTNTALGSGMTAAAFATSITLQVNGVTILDGATFSGMNAAERRAAVVSAVNEKSGLTGVTARDSGIAGGGVVLEAQDGRNIKVSGGAGSTDISTTLGLETGVHLGSYSLTSDKSIEVTEGNGRLADAGLARGTYDTQKAYVSTTVDLSASFNAGDFKINNAVVGDTLASDDTASSAGNIASAISKAAAINKLSDETGVIATVDETIVLGTAQTAVALTGTMQVNGITTASISTSADADASRRLTVEAINAISGQTGVRAIDQGNSADGIQLVADDGRNIHISLTTLTSAATGVVVANSVNYGTFTLSSDAELSIETGFNGEEGVNSLGLGVGAYGQGRSGESLDKLNISTQEGATDALTSLDNAINTVNTQRSKLGAVQNRFFSTISNLNTQSENLTAARSRIKDADFAKETAELTRNQILQQAGVAMLSQANQNPQQVLQLLQG